MPLPADAAEGFVGFHGAPFVEDEGLEAGAEEGGVVGAVPAVLGEGLIEVDAFVALGAKGGPEDLVAEDGVIQGEADGNGLAIGFEQAGAKGLVADLGFALEKGVAVEDGDGGVGPAGIAEVGVVLIDALIHAPGEAGARAIGQLAGEHFIKGGGNGVVGVQDVEVVGLVAEGEGAVEIGEHALAGGFGDADFARQGGKLADDFQGAVGGLVVEDDHAIGAQGLAGDGGQGLLDKFLAIAHGDGGDDSGFHGRQISKPSAGGNFKFQTSRKRGL